MNGLMKAAVFRGPEQIETTELPIPECPPNGLLIKVHACTICGGDVRNYHNGLKGGVVDQIMGHEIAGEVVEAKGAALKRFVPGERVALAPDVSCGHCDMCRRGYINLCENHRMLGTHFPGGYAQYIAVQEIVLTHGFIEGIPDGMSYEHASFAEPVAGVLAAHARLGTQLGDTVVIVGDGPIGGLHAEVAKARGVKRTYILGMSSSIQRAKGFIADELIYNDDPEKATLRVLELMDGAGADYVILAVPVASALSQATAMARKRGTIVIYGGAPKTSSMSQLDSNLVHYNELSVLGSFSYPATALRDALDALASKKVDAGRYLNYRVPLDRVVEGMIAMQSGDAIKTVILPWM